MNSVESVESVEIEKYFCKQECIPEGCVPSAAVTVSQGDVPGPGGCTWSAGRGMSAPGGCTCQVPTRWYPRGYSNKSPYTSSPEPVVWGGVVSPGQVKVPISA